MLRLLPLLVLLFGGSVAGGAQSCGAQATSTVPRYVVDYAPMVFLYSGEVYFPSDIGAQVRNTLPYLNRTAIAGYPSPLSLENLAELNNFGGGNVYLTSKTPPNVDSTAPWLVGVKPGVDGTTEDATSCAVITTDHGNGTVDAFYMYFYAFNFGGIYLDVLEIGDHVGDWEHNMIRFVDGQPRAVWYSQHSFGQAFSYEATEKFNGGQRPVSYSANGTHANYAINGTHNHIIPGLNTEDGPVLDYTDKGFAWDPVSSAYFFSYDPESVSFSAYDDAPTSWLKFVGRWGDEQYPDGVNGQESYLGLAHKYVSGPTGPQDKQLNRTDVCPKSTDAICVVQDDLRP